MSTLFGKDTLFHINGSMAKIRFYNHPLTVFFNKSLTLFPDF